MARISITAPSVDLNDLYEKDTRSLRMQAEKRIHQTVERSPADLKAYQDAAQLMLLKWSRIDKKRMYWIQLNVAGTLCGFDFGMAQREECVRLAQFYAFDALQHQNLFGAGTTVGFDQILIETRYDRQNTSTWATLRAKKSRLFLTTWQHIEKLRIPFYNLDQEMSWYAPLPKNFLALHPHQLVYSGMPSKAIKDPEMRAEYEAAIALNIEKWRVHNEQLELKQTIKEFDPVFEAFLVNSYSCSPFNLVELDHLLDEYKVGKERKKRILDAVVAQMKYAVEGATSLSSAPPPLPSFEPTPEATPTPTK